jgi:hypothetical protein
MGTDKHSRVKESPLIGVMIRKHTRNGVLGSGNRDRGRAPDYSDSI